MDWPKQIEELKIIEDKHNSLIDPNCWRQASLLTGKNPGIKGD
jgi:hypothetical protein